MRKADHVVGEKGRNIPLHELTTSHDSENDIIEPFLLKAPLAI
jgi:hypothetical protein